MAIVYQNNDNRSKKQRDTQQSVIFCDWLHSLFQRCSPIDCNNAAMIIIGQMWNNRNCGLDEEVRSYSFSCTYAGQRLLNFGTAAREIVLLVFRMLIWVGKDLLHLSTSATQMGRSSMVRISQGWSVLFETVMVILRLLETN